MAAAMGAAAAVAAIERLLLVGLLTLLDPGQAVLAQPTPPPVVPDLAALWDFGQPAVSEQRFRERLAGAQGDAAIVLQTQIARSFGLRKRFEEARAVLLPLRPALDRAGAEARVRWHLEWGRSWASATHGHGLPTEADRETARLAFRTAADLARVAGLDGLAVDALHMLPFTTTDHAQDLAWTREALAFALASAQPDARRWEASLRNNLGIALNELQRPAEALDEYQAALALLERNGASPGRQRVGHWMVAHTLRRLGRLDEAFVIQQRLERENAAAGTPDRYVFEELALLHKARGEAALAAEYEGKAAQR
jgi:tetratricopeptide (TPR) repeat protein